MEKTERNNLTSGTVWKKLLVFFLPIAAGTVLQQLYNAVDGLVVGRFVGTEALAAVGGSASQIINVLIGFFVSMTAGSAVVIAQIFGAGRDEDVKKASGNALVLCAIVGLMLAVIGLVFSPALLRLLKTPEDTMELSVRYMRIYFTGVPFIIVLNMESNIMRSVGDSVHPFKYMMAGCVSNIILDCVFVIVFSWGVAGVAIATVIAQVLNFALLTANMFSKDSVCRPERGALRLRGRFLSSMIKFGIPAGLQSSMYSVSNTIIQVAVNMLGTVVVASWAMTAKVDGIFWSVSNALGAAVTSFIGQNFGAGRMDRVKTCVKQGLIMSLVMTASTSVFILALGRPILHILTPDENVIDTTYLILKLLVPFYVFWSFVETISDVLRGAGDVTRPVIIIGLGVCLFRVVWVGTVFMIFRTLEALCLAYPITWFITGLSLFIYYRKGKWIERTKNGIIEKY